MRKIIYTGFWMLLISCNSGWLDVRPDDALVVPRSIEDYQALLDNTSIMNVSYVGGLGELAAGDFEVSEDVFLSSSATVRNSYSWSRSNDFFEGTRDPDWRAAWQRILHVNVVLEGIENVERTDVNKIRWDNVKGSALFHRAHDFYSLAQQYCVVYDLANLGDLGLPLRLSSNLNISVGRATLKETYEQIINDLTLAIQFLPSVAAVKTRPSKTAAYALLSKVYLSMREYENALTNADKVMDTDPGLLNYATLDVDLNYPFVPLNDEVIFHARLSSYSMFAAARLQVETELLDMYEAGDMRRQLFFGQNNSTSFYRGSYDGSNFFFAGLATDEILLIQAECRARAGDLDGALQSLNRLLHSRWEADTPYVDFESDKQDVILHKIIQERRKELCFRGIRWSDLRRLNKEADFQVRLRREIMGEVHLLEPDDARYVFPLDDNEINLGGLEQNYRQ